MSKIFRPILVFLAAVMALALSANAQTVSGQLTGVVVDSSGAAIPGATVIVTRELTKESRTPFKSDAEGRFTFVGLIPGAYSIRVEASGFKPHQTTGIEIGAQEHVNLNTIKLEVGNVSDSVEVIADSAHVETGSSSHGISLSQATIDSTPTPGHNYLNLLYNLPGAVHTSTSDSRGWAVGGGPGAINGRPGQLVVTINGVVSQDSGGAGTGGYLSPSTEAIGEVKVLTGAYTADYGARAGGQMNVSFKNGTNRFHGSAVWDYRHETLNANSFFNNRNTTTINGIPGQATPKSRYRYQDYAASLGGPVLIPGTRFNKSRTKLFFFLSEDYLHNVSTTAVRRFNLPTALEKNGDFSQTYLSNSSNSLIIVKDPTNGKAYPGNVLPQTSITAVGKAMMNLFPTGGKPGDFPYSVADVTGNRGYNSQFQWTSSFPREDRVLRVDYNLGQKDSSYISLIHDSENTIDGEGYQGPSGVQWGQLANNLSWRIPSYGISANEVHTFSPTLINEFSWGWNYAHQLVFVDENKQAQDLYDTYKLPALTAAAQAFAKQGYGGPTSLTSLYDANPLNLIPNISFGTNGAQTSINQNSALPSFGWDARWPFEGTDSIQNLTDNITWIKGAHSLKTGLYVEHTKRDVSVGPFGGFGTSAFTGEGTYWFGADSANPYDTGYSEANLLTGAVQAYGQNSISQMNHAHYFQTEWYATDNWKVSRRLTLDLGMRFVKSGHISSDNAVMNMFESSNYSSSAVGKILFPVCNGGAPATGSCSTANRGAQQYGGTGAILPFVRATQFDPNSYKNNNPYSGMTAYQNTGYDSSAVSVAPRVGFAWDVLGNGKMSLRGGFAIFYDRPYSNGVDSNGSLMQSAPTFFAPIYYNQTFATLGQTSGAFFSPQTAYTGPHSFPLPSVYDWNLNLQRDIGHGIVLDIGYVANTHHHGFNQGGYDANALPPLTTWQPNPGPNTVAAPAPTGASGYQAGYLVKTFLDPTSGGGGTSAFYSTNLLRALAGKFPGYANINAATSYGEGSYNSLQVLLNKRFGRRLQFNSNYTWQKTLNYGHNQWTPDQLNRSESGNAHAVNINFQYLFPDGTKLLPESARNFLTKGAFDGWNVSGIGAYYTGGILTVSCSVTGAPIGYYTGTPTSAPGTRCQMVGPLWLPDGSTPTSAGSVATTADPRLWFPFNSKSFVLPAVNSWGIGNTPPTLTHAPGFGNWDVSIYKEFRFGKEQGRAMQFRMTAYNIVNHFNPGNPATALTYDYNTGAQTSTSFGTITSQSGNPRRITLTLRLRF